MTPAESLISPTINLIAVPDGYDVFFTEDGGGLHMLLQNTRVLLCDHADTQAYLSKNTVSANLISYK